MSPEEANWKKGTHVHVFTGKKVFEGPHTLVAEQKVVNPSRKRKSASYESYTKKAKKGKVETREKPKEMKKGWVQLNILWLYFNS